MKNENVTSIQISVELRDELKNLGKKGEIYEEILWKCVKAYKKVNKIQ